MKVYETWVFKEGVEYGIFEDHMGFGEGVSANGIVLDSFIKPSDVDLINEDIKFIRWYPN